MKESPNTDAIVRTILEQWSRGKIRADVALPVIDRLLRAKHGDLLPSVDELMDALALEASDPVVQALVSHLKQVQLLEVARCCKDASRLEESSFYLRGLPPEVAPPWQDPAKLGAAITSGLRLILDWIFIRRKREQCPEIAAVVEEKTRDSINALRALLRPFRDLLEPDVLELLSGLQEGDHFRKALEEKGAASQATTARYLEDVSQAIPENADEGQCAQQLLETFRHADTGEERRRLLDLACSWPSCRIIPALLGMFDSYWARERAVLVLTWRFGGEASVKWAQWHAWL